MFIYIYKEVRYSILLLSRVWPGIVEDNRLCVSDRLTTYLGVVGGLLDDLWSHPERCSHKGFPLDLRIRQLTRYTEVRQFHLAVLRQQHVGSCGGLLALLALILLICLKNMPHACPNCVLGVFFSSQFCVNTILKLKLNLLSEISKPAGAMAGKSTSGFHLGVIRMDKRRGGKIQQDLTS